MILKTGSSVILPQWLAGLGVFLLEIQFGLVFGWSSPILARLASPDSSLSDPLHMTPIQASWVAALVNLGRLFGAIVGPVSASLVGSKRGICMSLLPLSAGWLLVALATSVECLYMARLLLGLGFGMAFSTFPLFIGEVAVPKIRGALISLAMVGAPLGQVVASICGSYLSISLSASLSLGLAVLLELLFVWLPESPHHLVKTGKSEAARRSINWYRAGHQVDEELAAVEKFVTANHSKSFMDKLSEFRSRPVRRATFQIIALFVFMQICGLNSVLFYMESILTKANFTFIRPSLMVVYVNVCGMFASALSVPLIDRCGRKFLLLVSSTGVTCAMVGLMVYFWMMGSGSDVGEIQWLPGASMFCFIVSFCVGLLPVPSTVLSETFPAEIKCIAAGISGVTGAIVAFISSKTYQPMVDSIGEAFVFGIYGLCSVVVIPYTLLFVPETKGKSLQEIQDKLTKK
ncbi:facilitated trehalose transporter Tret1-like [Copidosoma floridanum]|uniref:facilitated trehalose transporter Tret1-like n=1 Tax=Copidosoma floridanum TaxID=29053 RepID=UPI0006C9C460|nr:facilitated trehalose transporter Tret1-like [Copidosoma floridanum]